MYVDFWNFLTTDRLRWFFAPFCNFRVRVEPPWSFSKLSNFWCVIAPNPTNQLQLKLCNLTKDIEKSCTTLSSRVTRLVSTIAGMIAKSKLLVTRRIITRDLQPNQTPKTMSTTLEAIETQCHLIHNLFNLQPAPLPPTYPLVSKRVLASASELNATTRRMITNEPDPSPQARRAMFAVANYAYIMKTLAMMAIIHLGDYYHSGFVFPVSWAKCFPWGFGERSGKEYLEGRWEVQRVTTIILKSVKCIVR